MKMLKYLFSINKKGIEKYIIYLLGFKITITNYGLSRKEWIYFIEKINGSQRANKGDTLYFLRDKTILLNRLGEALKRDFVDLEQASYEEFEKFIRKHKKFIAKIKTGNSGKGMRIIDLKNNSYEPQNLYNNLKNSHLYLLEEYIEQCEILNKIYPKVVSTVRIYTLNINNSVELISYPLMRIPTSRFGLQNKDLITMKIDEETGKCLSPAIRLFFKIKRIEKEPIHPYSKYPLKDFTVPYFEEVKQLAKTAARAIPEIAFAGWDIAITDKGPVIVEGNGAPYTFKDEIVFETLKKGVSRKKYYYNVLEYFDFKKNLTQEKIDELAKKVFLGDYNSKTDFDIIIILGSNKCEYRAQYFCDLYRNQSEIPLVIASGGNNFTGEYEYKKIYDVLRQHNIPDGKILFEKESKNSKQNLHYSFKIINDILNKHKQITNKKIKVGIVTAGFHSVRINKMAEEYRNDFDISVLSAYGENTRKDNWYKTFNGYSIIINEACKNK